MGEFFDPQSCAVSLAVTVLLSASLLGCSTNEDPVTIDETGSVPAAEGTGATAYRAPYPDPPYGTEQGAIIEDFRFLGWTNPVAQAYDTHRLQALSLASYYDPKGQDGVKYVVITAAAVWCSACRYEWQELTPQKLQPYEDRGVVFFGTLFEDNDAYPAEPKDLVAWAKNFKVTFPFVLDPAFKLGAFFNREATPMTMVVDARTMKILWIQVGWLASGPGSLWDVLDQKLGG